MRGALGIVAGGDRLRGAARASSALAPASGAEPECALRPCARTCRVPAALRLTTTASSPVRRQLAALEAQAGVPAREAVGVDERAGAPFLVADEQQRDLLEELRAQRQLAQDAEREDVAALHVDRARADEVLAVALQRAVVVVGVDRVDVAEQHDAPGGPCPRSVTIRSSA